MGRSLLCNGCNLPILFFPVSHDLILVVQNLVVWTPFLIHWQHVKGHQDGKTIMALSQEAWLNIKAALVAKQALNQP